MIGINGTTVTGSFVDEKINGAGELKSESANYSGDFKDGVISGKGSLLWSNQTRQLKFTGLFDSVNFISGKLEIKDGDQVKNIEGLFEVPFINQVVQANFEESKQ